MQSVIAPECMVDEEGQLKNEILMCSDRSAVLTLALGLLPAHDALGHRRPPRKALSWASNLGADF